MTMEDRLKSIEQLLERHGKKLDQIQEILSTVAVQKTRLDNIERDVSSLWLKWDGLIQPEGPIDKIKGHQASCPRGQVKFLWWVVIGQVVSILTIASLVVRSHG